MPLNRYEAVYKNIEGIELQHLQQYPVIIAQMARQLLYSIAKVKSRLNCSGPGDYTSLFRLKIFRKQVLTDAIIRY